MSRMTFFIFALLILALPPAAWAQSTQTFTIQNGKLTGGGTGSAPAGGGKVALDAGQKMMFDASAKAANRDFKGAEAIYSQVLAADGGNAEAYLQRGVVRRELGDKPGMQADARAAITLVDALLRINPRDSKLYYRRSMALRLLGQFDQAKKNLQTGMQLGGSKGWETDLKAIELEEKMASFR